MCRTGYVHYMQHNRLGHFRRLKNYTRQQLQKLPGSKTGYLHICFGIFTSGNAKSLWWILIFVVFTFIPSPQKKDLYRKQGKMSSFHSGGNGRPLLLQWAAQKLTSPVRSRRSAVEGLLVIQSSCNFQHVQMKDTQSYRKNRVLSFRVPELLDFKLDQGPGRPQGKAAADPVREISC